MIYKRIPTGVTNKKGEKKTRRAENVAIAEKKKNLNKYFLFMSFNAAGFVNFVSIFFLGSGKNL